MLKKFGFDLDGIFIRPPPCVPSWLIEWFYRDQTKKKLSYRFPGIIEQKLRQLSHLPFIRPPVEKNCHLLQQLAKDGQYQFLLISGRFGFLEGLTFAWLRKYHLENVFAKIYLNTDNLQPHQFKEKILQKVALDGYFEDDPASCLYLAAAFPKLQFYWYTDSGNKQLDLKNITTIDKLDRILR